MNNHVAFFMILHVDDGKIVEHWDTIKPFPARSEWKNDSLALTNLKQV